MNDFKVSVIIPVYNAEKFIERAVLSALQQPQTHEVILIEDGSEDNSFILCEKMAKGHSRVKFFHHENRMNKGPGPTRNLAIRQATFPYISFLDADDYFLDGRFSVTEGIFKENADIDGVYECIGTHFDDEEGKRFWGEQGRDEITTVLYPIPEDELFYRLIEGKSGYFSIDGLTIKKDSLREELYFRDFKISQDTLFIYMASAVLKLRPGSIYSPVTMRGVHGINRHSKSKTELQRNQLLVFGYLLEWIIQNNYQNNSLGLLRKRYVSRWIDYAGCVMDYKCRKKELYGIRNFLLSDYKWIFSKYFPKYLLAELGWLRWIKSL